MYLGLDQMILRESHRPGDKQGLGFFGRYGFRHRDTGMISNYWQTGLSYTGLVPTRDRDVAGFSVSQSILSSLYREHVDELADKETIYELYYKVYITPWFVVTPDLQVISNPSGRSDARDAIVGGVRIRVIF